MTYNIPCGEFRTSYADEATIFPTRNSRRFAAAGLCLAVLAPLVLGSYGISLGIQIGCFAIAALGLNILVGVSGQISIGHAAFFGFGGFASAFISSRLGLPVALSVPLAGISTMIVGLVFALPAVRIKGLYLAIATLAAQVILEDFFARASWFTGGIAGAVAEPYSLFSITLGDDRTYFYVVLVHLVLALILASNILRTRDGRAMVALRDHYLSAEMMGIPLARYRLLAFVIAAFFAGVGGALQAHYLQYVSVESITILLSIQFLAMIIIGGLGSVMGTVMGAAFIVLLPEALGLVTNLLGSTSIGASLNLTGGLSLLREMAMGLAILAFLVLEPEGLRRRWQRIRDYWKLYPYGY